MVALDFKLILVKRHNTPCGAYADVFATPDGRATKVFRRQEPPKEDERAGRVFESEVAAYRKAMDAPELIPLVPEFFGKVVVLAVQGERGEDLSGNYHLDRAYQMRWVEGRFVKLNCVEDGKAIMMMFKARGICHVIDASAVQDSSGRIVAVVDFALEEHPKMAEENV